MSGHGKVLSCVCVCGKRGVEILRQTAASLGLGWLTKCGPAGEWGGGMINLMGLVCLGSGAITALKPEYVLLAWPQNSRVVLFVAAT